MCVSVLLLYLVHLLVLLLRIKVQQPISENGNLKGVSYKDGNKWNRNAYHKSNKGGRTVEESVHIMQHTRNSYVLGWH